ncbi:MAG TPA: FAD-dependent monooxygenase [Gemmataceae bacterium]|nr:FAD-dependent monooxygenase [Gemmataceae bacterium]
MREVETIVVGGGPGGSSAAGELRRAGRDCLVLERKPMPRLKLCAGWVTPKVLRDLAIAPAEYPHGMVKLETLKVYFGRGRRRARTVSAEQYSIRRVEFDAWLLKRSGAEVVQHTVREVAADGDGYVLDGAFRCRFLVGAGGTNCPVKKALFEPDRGDLIITQEVEFETTVRNPACVLWFPYAESWGYAWYVPKAGAVNIGFGGRRSRLEKWDRGRLWDDFVGLLRKEGCLTEEPPEPKGYSYYVGRRRKRVRKGDAFLIGDAAGLATQDLAEGIGPAVESGLSAAREILGKGTYCSRFITRYSLPFLARQFRNVAHLAP